MQVRLAMLRVAGGGGVGVDDGDEKGFKIGRGLRNKQSHSVISSSHFISTLSESLLSCYSLHPPRLAFVGSLTPACVISPTFPVHRCRESDSCIDFRQRHSTRLPAHISLSPLTTHYTKPKSCIFSIPTSPTRLFDTGR